MPTIVVHGKLDTVVPVADARTFVNTLKSKGCTYKYFELPNSGHNLEGDQALFEQSNEAVIAYALKYLK